MTRHNSLNYLLDGGFTYADGGDQFVRSDVEGLGKSFEFHTHFPGRGLPIAGVTAGTAAARPAAGNAGAVYWAYDTGVFSLDDGGAWQDGVMKSATQTLTNKTLTGPVINGGTFDKLTVSGPLGIAACTFVGILSVSGAPTTGTWGQYNWGFDEGGGVFMCLVAGTPGTWQQIGGPMTGDLKTTLRNTSDNGWVLGYGQTVDGTTAAYLNLWTYVNANGLVGAGKPFTGTQAALVLPNLRGATLAGLDNMGGSAANVLPALTALGMLTGAASHTLTASEVPALAYTTTIPPHTHQMHGVPGAVGNAAPLTPTLGQDNGPDFTVPGSDGTTNGGGAVMNASLTATTTSNAGGGAHSLVQPTYGVNIQIKL